jgi:hypothetical protein
LPSIRSTQSTISETAVAGGATENCAECGQPLAPDQRYCLSCGARRKDPRVGYERHLFAGDQQASPNGAASAPDARRQWSPLAAAAVLALLGIVLLVGILIGKDANNEEQQSTAPATTQTTTASPSTAAPPTPPATSATPGTGAGTTPPPATGGPAPEGAGAKPPSGDGAAAGAGSSPGAAEFEIPNRQGSP